MTNIDEEKLQILQLALGIYITNKLDEWGLNGQLMKSCRTISKDENLTEADASTVIMKELWKKLRETHKLRVVK